MQSFVVEESLNSVRVFWLEQDKLIEELHRIALEIGRRDDNVKMIVLFGSLAEKRAVPGSDADILIILKEDERRFLDRIEEWLGRFSIDFPVEVFPYTEKEMDVPIVREALRSGVVLYEQVAS